MPSGTERRSKLPSARVVACNSKLELAALRTMAAEATGKCWGSWTTPWREEKTVAEAERKAVTENAATVTTERRRMKSSERAKDRRKTPLCRWEGTALHWR